jgi:hypothetical protein
MQPFFAEVDVEVDGQTLKIVCNFGAIDFIERVTGEKMQEIIPQLADPSQSLAVKVLWGLLRYRWEGVTVDDAAALAFGPDKGKIAIAMGEAISRAFSFEEAKDENPPVRRGRSRSIGKSG